MTSIISVIGLNGCGKKTLLNVLSTGQNNSNDKIEFNSELAIDLSKAKALASYIKQKILIKIVSSDEPVQLEKVINESEGIVVMFDISDNNSFSSTKEKLIDFIIEKGEKLNFIYLVANKVDLLPFKDSIAQSPFGQYKNPKVKKYEISCKQYNNITSLLNDLIDSTIFPIKPLIENKVKYNNALHRIFRIMDKNNKGFISKETLNAMHLSLCNAPIDSEISDMTNNFTVDVFETLNKKAIESNELYIPWNFLYFFSYNNQLNLIYKNEDKNTELIFLNLDLFFEVRQNRNKEVSNEKIQDIFSICSEKEKLYEIFNEKCTKDEWMKKWKNLSEKDYSLFYKAYLEIGHEHSKIADLVNEPESKNERNKGWNFWSYAIGGLTILGAGLITGLLIYWNVKKKKV